MSMRYCLAYRHSSNAESIKPPVGGLCQNDWLFSYPIQYRLDIGFAGS